MPFLTEELFQRLPRRWSEGSIETIALAAFPEEVAGWARPEVEKDVEFLLQVVRGIRSLKQEYLKASQPATAYIHCRSDSTARLCETHIELIKTLARPGSLSICTDANIPLGCVVQTVDEDCSALVLVKGVVDIDAEISKLETAVQTTEEARRQLKKQVDIENYETRVPEGVRLANEKKVFSRLFALFGYPLADI